MSAGKRQTVWSANAWTLNIAGQTIESGKGADEFLKIEQAADDFSHTAGLDGEGCWNELKDDYTTVTVTLLQTSAGNGVLWAIHQASLLVGGLPVPLYIEDRKGASKLVSTDAMILKKPDETVAKEGGPNTWVLGCSPDTRVVGGH
jgi:hypothetical protein